MTRKRPTPSATPPVADRPTTKRVYRSSLREAQAEQTQQQIIEEAYRLLEQVPLEELSYAAIADSLGISGRTVYRHFPERADLVAAVARHHVGAITRPLGGMPRDLPGVAALLRHIHLMLEETPHTYRLFFQLPVRSQGGVHRVVEGVWSDVLEAIPERDRPAAAGLFELFMAPYAYDVLHENWGIPAQESSRICLAALDLIASALERDPQALSPDRGVPRRFQPTTDE